MNQLLKRLRGTALSSDLGVLVLLAGYPLLIGAVLWPNAWAFAVLALLTMAGEMRAAPGSYLLTALRQVHVDIAVRAAIREGALLLLLIRLGLDGSAWFVVFALGLLSLHVLRAVYCGLVLYLVQLRRLRLVTRRLDLSELRIPDAPRAALLRNPTRKTLHLSALPVATAAVGAAAGTAAWPALAGLAVAGGLLLAGIAHLAAQVLRNRRSADGERLLKLVNEQIRAYRPEVALYFSGSQASAYQVNMWLSAVERLDRPALIILRERGIVPLLGRTSIPVVCVPETNDVMLLDLASVHVVIFAANVGKNLHILRYQGPKSVFVNHGDSDKPASFNPYVKAYDEVWVAGPAGRDRYRDAGVGVRDDEIVEIGRPQLAGISTGAATPDPMFTVLYAPTWEGWSDDLLHSSVAKMGPKIVRMLLDQRPGIRVLYKPHPLTGTRDPAAARAHEKIVAMIERANAERDAGGEWRSTGAEAGRARELAELTRRLAELTGSVETGDEAQTARDAAWHDPESDRRWQETQEAWNAAYWGAEGWWRHRTITGAEPHLYGCFNRCDLLVTDISSVAGDFIASGKPFVVTNVGGLGDEEFRALFPTAATAAYLVGPECAELPETLAEVRRDGPDRMAEARLELKTYLLGPEEPDSTTRFANAVTALIDRKRGRAPAPAAVPAMAGRALTDSDED